MKAINNNFYAAPPPLDHYEKGQEGVDYIMTRVHTICMLPRSCIHDHDSSPHAVFIRQQPVPQTTVQT